VRVFQWGVHWLCRAVIQRQLLNFAFKSTLNGSASIHTDCCSNVLWPLWELNTWARGKVQKTGNTKSCSKCLGCLLYSGYYRRLLWLRYNLTIFWITGDRHWKANKFVFVVHVPRQHSASIPCVISTILNVEIFFPESAVNYDKSFHIPTYQRVREKKWQDMTGTPETFKDSKEHFSVFANSRNLICLLKTPSSIHVQ
jgi:hypothetical protein